MATASGASEASFDMGQNISLSLYQAVVYLDYILFLRKGAVCVRESVGLCQLIARLFLFSFCPGCTVDGQKVPNVYKRLIWR